MALYHKCGIGLCPKFCILLSYEHRIIDMKWRSFENLNLKIYQTQDESSEAQLINFLAFAVN